MWNDRPARRPIVGDLGYIEEMDVDLSTSELRIVLSRTGDSPSSSHVARLLSGGYLLEPWLRVRVDCDGEWHCAWGIEVSPEHEGGD